MGHGFEEFNGGAVFVAVGDDADIDGGEVVGDFVMGDRAGEDESIGDAEVEGLGGERVAERAIANEHEVDGGVMGDESGELGEELIEAMPRDEPADEADDEGIGWGEALADGGAVGGGEEGSGVDGIGEDENFFFGDAEGDDAALEVWRDDDDAAGVLESEAIGEAREWEEPGGGADAFVAGEFVDFDDEGDVAVVGEEGGGEEEKGVAFVDERRMILGEEGAIPEEGGEIVGEFEEFENQFGGEGGEIGEEAAAVFFFERVATCGEAGIDSGGAREVDLVAKFFESGGDA